MVFEAVGVVAAFVEAGVAAAAFEAVGGVGEWPGPAVGCPAPVAGECLGRVAELRDLEVLAARPVTVVQVVGDLRALPAVVVRGRELGRVSGPGGPVVREAAPVVLPIGMPCNRERDPASEAAIDHRLFPARGQEELARVRELVQGRGLVPEVALHHAQAWGLGPVAVLVRLSFLREVLGRGLVDVPASLSNPGDCRELEPGLADVRAFLSNPHDCLAWEAVEGLVRDLLAGRACRIAWPIEGNLCRTGRLA